MVKIHSNLRTDTRFNKIYQYLTPRELRRKLQKEQRSLSGEEQEPLNPNQVGTNIFLSEIGLKQREVNQAVEIYGKEAVKSATRLAYEAGLKERRDYLVMLGAVAEFGPEFVEEFGIKRKVPIDSLVQDFESVQGISLCRLVKPKNFEFDPEELSSLVEAKRVNLVKIGPSVGYVAPANHKNY